MFLFAKETVEKKTQTKSQERGTGVDMNMEKAKCQDKQVRLV